MRDYVGLVYQQNSSHLHSLCLGILFKCSVLGIHSFKTLQLYILIGGEIYSSDVNPHKGYSLICLKKIPLLLDTRYFLILVVGSSSCFQMYPIVLIINDASDVLVVDSEFDKRMKFTAYVWSYTKI